MVDAGQAHDVGQAVDLAERVLGGTEHLVVRAGLVAQVPSGDEHAAHLGHEGDRKLPAHPLVDGVGVVLQDVEADLEDDVGRAFSVVTNELLQHLGSASHRVPMVRWAPGRRQQLLTPWKRVELSEKEGQDAPSRLRRDV